MSDSHESESYFDEEEEEDVDDGSTSVTFGTEFGRNYTGVLAEPIDQIKAEDEADGHSVLPVGFILDHRYQIKSLIGRGTFCLVWYAWDYVEKENVAIKVLKTTVDSECFEDEYKLNRYLSDGADDDAHIILFKRMFYHASHACLVFEVGAHSILVMVNYFDSTSVLPPLSLVKKIIYDTLKGLAFMHSRGVIHTDLKLENVIGTRPIFPYHSFDGSEVEVFNPLEDDPSTVDFKLIDIGNSCFINNPVNDLIQTRQYRAPEVLLGRPYDTSADIWSLACMTFELSTRIHLFDPELDDTDDENSQNRILFDAVHLSMIENVLGPIPLDWASEGEQYTSLFNDDGTLIARHRIHMGSVFDLLLKNQVPEIDALEIARFIEPMLSIIPSRRPSAEELLDSPWLHQL